MVTDRYLFQSPYNSKVQYGRLDPSVANEQKKQENNDSISNVNNTSVKDAQVYQASQTNKLDVYA